MNRDQIIKASYFTSLAGILLGIVFRINHFQSSEWLLIFSAVVIGVFVINCIQEISRSNRINSSEKSMWIVGLIFMCIFVGTLYYFSGRKRVVAS